MSKESFREYIEKVRIASDLAVVAGEVLELDRYRKALCPFHEERTPSFSIHPSGEYFKCFGCGATGDVFKFIMLRNGCGFREAVDRLADRAGISRYEGGGDDTKTCEEERRSSEILTATAHYYHSRLTSEARRYLEEGRGLTSGTISEFQLGWADGTLHAHLAGLGFGGGECMAAGVLKRDQAGKLTDFFHRRIILPSTRRGQVVHLSGRALNDGQHKYLHLPGEIGHLFNEDALREESVLLCEGILDALTAIQAGFPAVAVQGDQAFKPEFVAKFSRCRRIHIAFDGDESGFKGALKAAELLGDRARIVGLPDGEDLNSYLRNHEPSDLKTLLDNADDLPTFMAHDISADIPPMDLVDRLQPLLECLSKREPAYYEAFLKEVLRPRFKLGRDELAAYRSKIRQLARGISDVSELSDVSRKPVMEETTAIFDGLVDLVLDKGQPAFLMREGEVFRVVSSVELEGKRLVPPKLRQIPWLLPDGGRVLAQIEDGRRAGNALADAALFADLKIYLREMIELPDGDYYDLLAAWVLHTHLLEGFHFSPIISLFAVPERGKTRTGMALICLARRGVRVESLSAAYIVRLARNFGASLFFDVLDVWRKAENSNAEDILLHRFERGATVPRVFPDRGNWNDIEYYDTFGATVVATNVAPNGILDTRTIGISMPPTQRVFESPVTAESAMPLKERLLAFRGRHMGQALPEFGKPAPGRLGDILKPLYQVTLLASPKSRHALDRLTERYQHSRKVEFSTSLEAKLLMIIAGLERAVEHGRLATMVITNVLNRERQDQEAITAHKVGHTLKALGFQKTSSRTSASAIVWDREFIGRLLERHGLPQMSETSESPESDCYIHGCRLPHPGGIQ